MSDSTDSIDEPVPTDAELKRLDAVSALVLGGHVPAGIQLRFADGTVHDMSPEEINDFMQFVARNHFADSNR